MPRVVQQKQVSNGTTSSYAVPQTQAAGDGSILGRVKPVAQLIDDWMKVCIYGENRVGKTCLSAEFPKPAVLIAMDPNRTGGALSVTKVEGLDYVRLEKRADVVQMARELASDRHYQTVIVDGATSLQDMILCELRGDDVPLEMLRWGLVSEDQYRERSEQCRETLRPYLNLEKHVVIIAKQKDHRKVEGDKRPKMLRGFRPESVFSADLGGATAGWLADCCDLFVQLYMEHETRTETVPGTVVAGVKQRDTTREVETGRQVRRLRTLFDVNYVCGIRSASPTVVPKYIQGVTPKEMFDDLVRVIRGEKANGGKY
jgi:hypothetical protein